MEYIDIHTHILTGVDDGAKSHEESLKLVAELKKQGVTKILATPHFYAETASLDDTLHKTKSAYVRLINDLSDDDPAVKLGYEIHYFKNVSKIDEIDKLTIQGTRYLLLELAYSQSCENAVNDIISLSLDRNIIPILAHIERFTLLPGFDKILEAIKDGFCIGQINASAFSNRGLRKAALNLIKDGYGEIIASDTHSVLNRPPEFDNAFKFISKKLGEDEVLRLKRINDNLCKKIF